MSDKREKIEKNSKEYEEFTKLFEQEMMGADEAVFAPLANNARAMYQAFKHAGFTASQSLSLVETLLVKTYELSFPNGLQAKSKEQKE
ncbi:hypothetical protein [Pseudobutyrivibrio sp.]